MNRKTLDALAAHHGLSSEGAARMLDLAAARPSRSELERFGERSLALAGALSLGAGIVFLVAANWSALPVFGRFALVQAVLVVGICVSLWRPPPARIGRYALLVAFIVTGALLALVGIVAHQVRPDVARLPGYDLSSAGHAATVDAA